jgi:hypothetical protein
MDQRTKPHRKGGNVPKGRILTRAIIRVKTDLKLSVANGSAGTFFQANKVNDGSFLGADWTAAFFFQKDKRMAEKAAL